MIDQFLEQTGAQIPLICGAMYPCSNPELIAAVSGAGGIGVIQPISMSYVHGHDLREGIRMIQSMICSDSNQFKSPVPLAMKCPVRLALCSPV